MTSSHQALLRLKRTVLFLFLSFILFSFATTVRAEKSERVNDSETISVEDFVKSEAAQLFQSGDEKHALIALDALIKKYPNDPLLVRYRAMALDRLGQSDEAIHIYQQLLEKEANHLPTRFFLGQAYERKGNKDLAVKEWRWVVDEGEGTPYKDWAIENLTRLGETTTKPKHRMPKGFSIAARYGYEYDSNVILKPENKSLASPRDPNAGRHQMDLLLRQRVINRRDIAVDLFYAGRQSLHDDGLDEFNFTSQEFGINGRKRVTIKEKDVIFGGQYEFLSGFLDGDLFSLRNRWTLSADTRLTPQTRTVLADRLTWAEFGPDGSTPSLSSRDGLYHDVILTQYWYTRDLRRHFFVREEFNSGYAQGENFDQIGNTTRIGIHTPLIRRTELDFSSGLQFAVYPNFNSLSTLDTDRRRDLEWDLYGALTYFVTPRIGLRVFYRYINSDNQNGFFEYDRHIAGVQVLFSQSY